MQIHKLRAPDESALPLSTRWYLVSRSYLARRDRRLPSAPLCRVDAPATDPARASASEPASELAASTDWEGVADPAA